MVHTVLFDVDGVLVHPWRLRALLARDYAITPAMTASFFEGPFLECVEGRADLVEVLPPFLTSWGWAGSASEFVEAWLSVENAPDEAVLSVVADIRHRGVPCFVASTQERRRAQYLAIEMRFNQPFDGLFFSTDVGAAKPKEEFFKGRCPSSRTFGEGAALHRRRACQRGGCQVGGLVRRAVHQRRTPPNRCGTIHGADSRCWLRS